MEDDLNKLLQKLETDPSNCNYWFDISTLLFAGGQFERALNAAKQAVNLVFSTKYGHNLLSMIELVPVNLKSQSGDYLLQFINNKELQGRSLTQIQCILIDKYSSYNQQAVSKAISDPLLISFLNNEVITDLTLETAVKLLRAQLMDQVICGEPLNEGRLLLAAICSQQLLNDQLFAVSDLEAEKLQVLANMHVQTADTILVKMAYSNLSEQLHAWKQNKALLIKSKLYELAEDLAFYKKVALKTAEVTKLDTQSEDVERFYRHFPYPKWKTVRYQSVHLTELVRQYGLNLHAINSILVAGCGTGRQVVELALSNPDISITAIDLSPASLEYAKLMMQRYGLSNVRFKQLDILNVDELDMRFDFILSTGVLHHMEEPKLGLAALTKVLNPNGAMLLGLYSKQARKPFVNYRKVLQRLEQKEVSYLTNEQIASWREQELPQMSVELLKVDELYTIGGIRDTFLHPVQHEYNWLEVNDLLASCKAQLRAVVMPAAAKLNEIQPTVFIEGDYLQLHNIEKQHPSLFIGMYNFFVTLSE